MAIAEYTLTTNKNAEPSRMRKPKAVRRFPYQPPGYFRKTLEQLAKLNLRLDWLEARKACAGHPRTDRPQNESAPWRERNERALVKLRRRINHP